MLIGEIVRKTGLSKDTIRSYEAIGLLHSSPREAGSRIYRDYDDQTYERLAIIAMAKRLQFSLKELVAPIDRLLSDNITRGERAAIMREKIAEVDQRIAELQSAKLDLIRFAEEPEKDIAQSRMKELGLWYE